MGIFLIAGLSGVAIASGTLTGDTVTTTVGYRTVTLTTVTGTSTEVITEVVPVQPVIGLTTATEDSESTTQTTTTSYSTLSTELFLPMADWYEATTDASESVGGFQQLVPITDTPVTETLNPDGSLNLVIAPDQANGYYDAGFFTTIGTLGLFESDNLVVTGSNFDVNLIVNFSDTVWAPYGTGANSAEYAVSFGPSQVFGTCSPDNCNVVSSDTISLSSQFLFSYAQGCGLGDGTFSVQQVLNACGSSAPVTVWVGLDTGSSGGSATVTSMYLTPIS